MFTLKLIEGTSVQTTKNKVFIFKDQHNWATMVEKWKF